MWLKFDYSQCNTPDHITDALENENVLYIVLG